MEEKEIEITISYRVTNPKNRDDENLDFAFWVYDDNIYNVSGDINGYILNKYYERKENSEI